MESVANPYCAQHVTMSLWKGEKLHARSGHLLNSFYFSALERSFPDIHDPAPEKLDIQFISREIIQISRSSFSFSPLFSPSVSRSTGFQMEKSEYTSNFYVKVRKPMALGNCPECGHVMSTTAAFCVYCGGTMPAIQPKETKEINSVQCNGKEESICHLSGGAGKDAELPE